MASRLFTEGGRKQGGTFSAKNLWNFSSGNHNSLHCAAAWVFWTLWRSLLIPQGTCASSKFRHFLCLDYNPHSCNPNPASPNSQPLIHILWFWPLLLSNSDYPGLLLHHRLSTTLLWTCIGQTSSGNKGMQFISWMRYNFCCFVKGIFSWCGLFFTGFVHTSSFCVSFPQR